MRCVRACERPDGRTDGFVFVGRVVGWNVRPHARVGRQGDSPAGNQEKVLTMASANALISSRQADTTKAQYPHFGGVPLAPVCAGVECRR